MIQTKEELKRYLELEKPLYIRGSIAYIRALIFQSNNLYLWRLVKSMRKAEYYFNNRNRNPLCAALNVLYRRKSNRLGRKLGIEISSSVFAEGLQIFHPVGIVINGDAHVGKNCKLHGNNVIGNMGTDLGLPTIGDNVRLGAGAKVLGNVYIANNVQIGAGAIVLHSCYEEGALLTGIPATIHVRSVKKA